MASWFHMGRLTEEHLASNLIPNILESEEEINMLCVHGTLCNDCAHKMQEVEAAIRIQEWLREHHKK